MRRTTLRDASIQSRVGIYKNPSAHLALEANYFSMPEPVDSTVARTPGFDPLFRAWPAAAQASIAEVGRIKPVGQSNAAVDHDRRARDVAGDFV